MIRTELIKALHYTTGQPCEIRLAEGRIISVRQGLDPKDNVDALAYAAPGLVDLQINGYSVRILICIPLLPV